MVTRSHKWPPSSLHSLKINWLSYEPDVVSQDWAVNCAAEAHPETPFAIKVSSYGSYVGGILDR